MEQIDFACLLSLNWKNRLTMCLYDINNSITSLSKLIDLLIQKDEDLSPELEKLDRLNYLKQEIEKLVKDFTPYPLIPEEVEKIAKYESDYYSIIMTPENLEILKKEIDDEKDKLEQTNQLIEKIDQMWDNGDPEEVMKEEIRKFFGEIYKFPEPILSIFSEQFFNFINGGKNVRVNLSEDKIRGLDRVKIERGEDKTCGICLETFNIGEETILLKCSHSYHPNCIVPWLKMSVNCPTCRTDLR